MKDVRLLWHLRAGGDIRSAAVCVLIGLLFICAPLPGRAQELYLLGGALTRSTFSDQTYGWGLEYREGIGENFAASFSYLNEGHLPANHRDGVAAQLWIRKQFLSRQLSVAVGAGPYRYFDTRIAGEAGGFSDSHGWGGVVSGTATWYTKSRWIGQVRINWITVQRGPETVSFMAGIGYQLDPPTREGPIPTTSVPAGMKYKQEVTGYLGFTILNSDESEKSLAGGIEYRLNFLRHLDWTAAWIHEADTRIARRNGLVTQLWLVRPFMDDRLCLALGAGPYLQLDEGRSPRNGEGGAGHVSAMVSASANYRFTDHWSMRVTWSRLVTNYHKDSDIILVGPGYRF